MNDRFKGGEEKLQPWGDIETMLSIVIITLFRCSWVNDTSFKIHFPKCPAYKRTKDPVAHFIHFKMAIVTISLSENKEEVMYCKLFVATF